MPRPVRGAKPAAQSFAFQPAELASAATMTAPGGIPIGRTVDGALLGLVLSRAAPTRACMVTDLGMAKLLALRALAAGGRVAVITGRSHQWISLRVVAERAADRLDIMELAQPHAPPATADRPVLVVHDAGVAPQDPPTPRQPYQTFLHLLPGVHPHAATIVRGSDPLLVAGLRPEQAGALAEMLDLDAAAARGFANLAPKELYIVTAGSVRRVTVRIGATEIAV